MIQDNRLPLKEKFLEYFRELPIQHLAADFIKVHRDTITNWKKEDDEFSAEIALAKAEWAKKTTRAVRSKEWLLERLMRKTFAPPKQDVSLQGQIDHIIISREPKK